MAHGMDRTVRKHEAIFREHPRQFAHYLATMGVYYLRAGLWKESVAATARGFWMDPTRSQHLVWLGAAVAGPRAYRLTRRKRVRA